MSDNDKILQNQNVKLDVEGLSEEQQRAIERALKETSDRASDVGEKFSDMGKRGIDTTTELSRSLADLAYLGEKLDTPISQLKALDYAFEQIGAKPGTALANLENFYSKIREAPQILKAFEGNLGKWGFEDKGTVKDKYESALKALAKEQASGPVGEQMARAFARKFGLDEELIDRLSHAQAEYDKYHAESIARTKGIDEMGPGAIALTQSLNHLWAALNDVATRLFGENFEAISGILDTWTKWIRDNSGSLVHDFEEIGRQFVKAGGDIDAVFGPLLRNASAGFILVGDAVARVLGLDEKSGMRGIRYLLDTVAVLFGASVLIKLLSFLNSLALGTPSALITGIFEGLGWGTAIAFGGVFAGLSGIYETVKPQPAGEGGGKPSEDFDELYRQAHPGWTPDKPKDPDWKPPKTAADASPGGLPAAGTVTGLYGDARATHSHAGWDISGEMGSPIVSTTGGTIVRAQRQSGYGLTIDVKSPDNQHVFRYAHLQGMNVNVGDTVKAGQQVGTMGNTGTSHEGGPGGVHVHTEVHDAARYDAAPFGRGSTIDPAEYYGLRARGSHVPLGGQEKPPALASPVANPLRNVDPVGFHNAIKNLQHDSLNLPAYQPARVVASGNHVYKNNVTVYADNAHEAAIAVGARMDEIHARSIDRLQSVGSFEDFQRDFEKRNPKIFKEEKGLPKAPIKRVLPPLPEAPEKGREFKLPPNLRPDLQYLRHGHGFYMPDASDPARFRHEWGTRHDEVFGQDMRPIQP